jgi:hypothetical protein
LSRQPVTVETLAFLADLPELRSLNLGQCVALDDAVLTLLAKLPHLEMLYLAGTGISDAGLAQLAAFPSLKSLSVGGSTVTRAGADRFAAASPHIRLGYYESAFLREQRIAQ